MVKLYQGSPFIQRRSGTGCKCGRKSISNMEKYFVHRKKYHSE
jgi:hypothetical protein